MSIELGDGRADFTITVTPAAKAKHAWAKTERFAIGYNGSEDLDRERQRWLARTRQVLGRVETRLPSDLVESGGLFLPSTPPQDRFFRLFPFCTVERSRAVDEASTEVMIRTTAKCNQACPFCSGPPSHDAPSSRTLMTCIEQAA
ncbi:hypothetical protein ACFL6C_13260, partial [Myxococcota bacterium]